MHADVVAGRIRFWYTIYELGSALSPSEGALLMNSEGDVVCVARYKRDQEGDCFGYWYSEVV